MGGVSGGALAVAVSQGGGLGLIGAGYSDSQWIRSQFERAGECAVGIGFITWHLARHPDCLDAALAYQPAAVMLSFGDPAPFVSRIKDAGAKLLLQVQSLSDAEAAASLGADVIIAQGTEAGGHGGTRATLALVPAVVDAVAPVPVLAAGGIVDGRGLAAALVLGASGALVGTRFYAATEAQGHPQARRRLIEAGGDETLRTRVFDIVRDLPWPRAYTGRAIANAFTQSWHGRESTLERQLSTQRERYNRASAEGDLSLAVVWASEAVDMIHSVEPAAKILEDMMKQAVSAIACAHRAAIAEAPARAE
jgi:nitronate monooxygenase